MAYGSTVIYNYTRWGNSFLHSDGFVNDQHQVNCWKYHFIYYTM